jgi:Tol biopolymer transport system component
MTLVTCTRVGPYEILGHLGAGGMGEVYRARDTRLKRDVAIKVLPEAFAADPDRLARFQREAEVLATLNHPNIAAVYGLEETAAASGIVLELVDGPTLTDRIARGPVPLDEALSIARQIADALEAAHERGIIHRDLKPANIKVTPEGTVKVLDFGLAKMLESGAPGGSALSMSPTLVGQATLAGVILGTAAYMSPEQARGKPVDRRTDIWAFGCVLYEMLTGRKAFEAGETVSDAVAAILTREPDWNALPADTPPFVRALLRRCLRKDSQKRLPHIGVARLDIEEGSTETVSSAAVPTQVTAPRPLWRRAVPATLAALVAGLLVSAAMWRLAPSAAVPVTRFLFTLPDGQRFTTTNRQLVAVSRDGTEMAYVANSSLNLKSMSALESRVIPGTENSSGIANPVFSPDGQWIAFWTLGDLTLRRIAVVGGAPVTICRTESFLFLGMSWDESGIVFGQGGRGIMRVSADGGAPEVLVTVKDGETAHGPQILPDGQTVLFTLASGSAGDRWDKAQIVVHSLKSGQRKTLVVGGSDARYLPTGHLVYALGGTLFAVPFDPGRLEISKGATPVLEGVRRSLGGITGSAQFATSNTGSLVYIPGPASTSAAQDLALIDRKGFADALKFPSAHQYEHPRVSPDGKRVAFGTDDGKDVIVWIYDLAGTTAMRRLTLEGRNRFPIWSADGQRVAFQSDREGDLGIFWQRADGADAADRLTRPEPGTSHLPESWSPKGDVFSFSAIKGVSEVSLWTFSLQQKKAAPVDGVRSSSVFNSVFSPDGRWLAYALRGIYVQPFPGTGARYQIDSFGGIYPLWSRDARELFYVTPGQLLAVDVRTQPSFVVGRPTSLPRGFLVNGTGTPRSYDITPDGRFLGVIDSNLAQPGSAAAPQLQIVLNWFEELKTRVPPLHGGS